MGENTKISWADHTFNPWIGCSPVSTGCKFCYAETFATKKLHVRWGNNPRHITAKSTWDKPLLWNKRAAERLMIDNYRPRVFCASLADVFEDNPQLDAARALLWELIEKTPYLDWLLLTKRPGNFEKFIPLKWKKEKSVARNVWVGTTICNQLEYDVNWPLLRDFCATYDVPVSFVSYEPLLGHITPNKGVPDWSLIGGESGFLKDARPMSLKWVKDLIDSSKSWKNQIFFKQLGTQQAKMLNMADKKGENGIELLPPAYDWLKIREIPFCK